MKNQPNKGFISSDIFYTPPELCQKIVNHFRPSGSILEPCCGSGNFVRELEKFGQVTTFEIEQGRDFLTSPIIQHYDWVCTNFAWSKFRKFLIKSLSISNNIVTLCTINHIVGLKARMRDIHEAGFKIEEIALCDTPKEFPQSGFQLGAIYLKRVNGENVLGKIDYKIKMTQL